MAWTHTQKIWWLCRQTSTTVDITTRQRKRTTQEHLEKRFGEGNMDGRLQVQLEEDGCGGSRQSWMEASGLWPMIHWEQQCISEVKVCCRQRNDKISKPFAHLLLVCLWLKRNINVETCRTHVFVARLLRLGKRWSGCKIWWKGETMDSWKI